MNQGVLSVFIHPPPPSLMSLDFETWKYEFHVSLLRKILYFSQYLFVNGLNTIKSLSADS